LLLRISLRQIESQLQAAQLSVAGGRQQMASLIGIPSLRIDRVEGNLRVQLPDYTDQYAREEVVARNALVQSAQVDIARQRILLQRAEVQTVSDLDVTSGWQYNPLQAGGSNPAYVGVFFDIPLWNRNQGNIRTAQWNVTESMAVANSTQNDLLRQLADALARYRSARAAVTNFERSILPLVRRTITLVQDGYEKQVFDLPRLLQAQQALNQTNLDYIDALLNRISAAADVANLLQVEQFP
jgi:cobalt-zinc-cadmium efflux system outer membrane protein